MPAYRSDAEGLVRTAVVAKLREFRPHARIIHEINNGWGNRFDLIAVSPAEIIAVEVKSEKDTLDLLPGQYEGMKRVAHHVIIAYHEKHKVELWGAIRWRFPEAQKVGEYDWGWKWSEPKIEMNKALPPGALDMIWQAELHKICQDHLIPMKSRATCEQLRKAIRWSLTGEKVTKAICGALMARSCIEADDVAPPKTERLCGDCPPVGYPTDITRCLPCPKRTGEAP